MLRLAPPVLCLSLLLALPSALLQASNFVEPQSWSRGAPQSTYQGWDIFEVLPDKSNPSAAGAHPPDLGVNTIEGGQPTLEELSTDSFITGSRNIYSFSSNLDVQVDVPNYGLGAGYFTTLVLQTRTQGTAIDPASVMLGTLAPDATKELGREEIQSPGGSTFITENWYRWVIPAEVGNAASYELTFKALGTSMSLDSVLVDTWTGLEERREPVPGLTLLAGDANGDGKVDLSDFGILKQNFGTGSAAAEGDFNGDSKIDLTDFGILKENFGKSSTAAVPEPATLSLSLLGLAMFGCLRRRQR